MASSIPCTSLGFRATQNTLGERNRPLPPLEPVIELPEVRIDAKVSTIVNRICAGILVAGTAWNVAYLAQL